MNRPNTWLMMIILALLSQGSGIAQSPWVFKKELDGIKCWTRQVEGSKYDEYKVETITEGTLNACISVLHDESTYALLFDDTVEAKLLKKDNDAHTITYLHTNLPWPVRDRDGYYDNHFKYLADDNLIRVEFSCLEGYTKKKSTIRIESCRGTWEFKQLEGSIIRISQTLHLDPKGAIPAWIVNKRTVDSPIHTLAAMKRLIQLAKYQDKSFDFIK